MLIIKSPHLSRDNEIEVPDELYKAVLCEARCLLLAHCLSLRPRKVKKFGLPGLGGFKNTDPGSDLSN